jgi:ADP-ribose pyrophosphatase YjhB (NUDIX family)
MNEQNESNKLNEELFVTIPKSLELKFPSALHTVDMTLIYQPFNWRKFRFETYFLLCKKHSELDKPYWRFSGGFYDVYKDKTLEETVIREFKEETGIDISGCEIEYISSHLIDDERYKKSQHKIVTSFYGIELYDREIFNKDLTLQGFDDVALVKWFDLNSPDIEEIINPIHLDLFNDLKSVYARR